jgi:hypothetical protein
LIFCGKEKAKCQHATPGVGLPVAGLKKADMAAKAKQVERSFIFSEKIQTLF